jgi:hypothetical protein
VRVFAFVAVQKADFPVRTLCRVCKVSTSGFYAYEAREAAGPSPAAIAKAVIARHIARVHKSSRRRYGSPRVTAQLAREGIVANHKAVEAEMARQGLVGRCSRRKMHTTRRDPSKVPAIDLVERDFERQHIDELWIGDATYIWTDEGWCYLATVIDACSRRLLGWSITTTCAPSSASMPSRRPWRHEAGGASSPPASCSTLTTAPNLGSRSGRNTVADAYGQLVSEGWLVAVQGSGTTVASHAPFAPRPHQLRRSQIEMCPRAATEGDRPKIAPTPAAGDAARPRHRTDPPHFGRIAPPRVGIDRLTPPGAFGTGPEGRRITARDAAIWDTSAAVSYSTSVL